MKGLIFGMLVTVCGSVLLLLVATGICGIYLELFDFRTKKRRKRKRL